MTHSPNLDVERIDDAHLEFEVPDATPRLARGTAGHAKLVRDQLDADRECVELRSLIVETIERTLPPPLRDRILLVAPEPVLMTVDARRLACVIAELLVNALVEPGSIIVGLELRPDTVKIWVSGDGPGRPASRESRQIVEAHGGTIALVPRPRAGSRCAFALPLGQVQKPGPRLAECRGLLVGDKLPHASDLVRMLAREGMIAQRVATRDALRAVRKRRPDAVVVDADAPGSGELILELRRLMPLTLLALVTNRRVEALRTRERVVLVNPSDAGELFAVITRRLT